MTGRPSSYTPEIGADVCARIAEGKSLVSVCHDMLLEYRTVARWLAADQAFRQSYERAREAQADYLADDILDVSNDGSLSPEDRRIRIDARKWYAGKLRPKKYGDRLQQELSGPDGGPIDLTAKVSIYLPENGRDKPNG